MADDHILVAEACKHLLDPEFEVIGIVENGRALVKKTLERKPDIVVLDIAMPRMDGLDAGAKIKELLPATKLVYLTMNMAPEIAAEAFRRGASAYVVKSSAASELITAIQRALASESYLSPLITRETVDFLLRRSTAHTSEKRITDRQSEILRLVAEGVSMKEIAAMLNLNSGTVAFHKYKIMENLGLKTNAELLLYAIRHHLIE